MCGFFHCKVEIGNFFLMNNMKKDHFKAIRSEEILVHICVFIACYSCITIVIVELKRVGEKERIFFIITLLTRSHYQTSFIFFTF